MADTQSSVYAPAYIPSANPPAVLFPIPSVKRTRRNRLAEVRSELLALVERTGEPSIKSELARLAESLLPAQPVHRKQLPPLTESQIRQLLYIAKSRPEWRTLHAILLFVACGGFYCTELFQLRRGDVVLDRGKPRVSIAAGPRTNGFKPSRIVTLSPLLAEAAEVLLASGGRWGSTLPEHFVLIRQTSKYGRPCDPTRPGYIKLFSRQFDDVRSLANLPDATWRKVELSGRLGVFEC